MMTVSETVKAILEKDFKIRCQEVGVSIRYFGELKEVNDPRMLNLSPYNSFWLSVTDLRWDERGAERVMDSLGISCTVGKDGRVLEEFKVIGPRDTGDMDIPELKKSDEKISAKVRRAFGQCVKTVRLAEAAKSKAREV